MSKALEEFEDLEEEEVDREIDKKDTTIVDLEDKFDKLKAEEKSRPVKKTKGKANNKGAVMLAPILQKPKSKDS